MALVSVGLTTYAFQLWQPSGQTMPFVPLAPTIRISFLADIPFVGDVFFAQSVLTDAAVLLLAATLLVLRLTLWGLVINASGDDPPSAGCVALPSLACGCSPWPLAEHASVQVRQRSWPRDGPTRKIAGLCSGKITRQCRGRLPCIALDRGGRGWTLSGGKVRRRGLGNAAPRASY
jgi:hypothetical protein